MPAKLPFRLGVGIILLNKNGKVFVAKRIDSTAEAWQMPQGGIDEDEDPMAAALREMEEEIGTRKAHLIAESPEWLEYDLPAELVGKIWKGKYRGQRQKWYLFQFDGKDDDINIATAEPEFSEWRWAAPHTLPDLIVPFKRDLYVKLLDIFKPYFVWT